MLNVYSMEHFFNIGCFIEYPVLRSEMNQFGVWAE